MTIGMIVAIVFGALILVAGIGALIYGFANEEVAMGVRIFIIGLIVLQEMI